MVRFILLRARVFQRVNALDHRFVGLSARDETADLHAKDEGEDGHEDFLLGDRVRENVDRAGDSRQENQQRHFVRRHGVVDLGPENSACLQLRQVVFAGETVDVFLVTHES